MRNGCIVEVEKSMKTPDCSKKSKVAAGMGVRYYTEQDKEEPTETTTQTKTDMVEGQQQQDTHNSLNRTQHITNEEIAQNTRTDTGTITKTRQTKITDWTRKDSEREQQTPNTPVTTKIQRWEQR